MREKLFLLASIAFLSGSANHALFFTPSITEPVAAASLPSVFVANLQSFGAHAVAPQRRMLVQLAREKEAQQEAITPQPQNQTHYRQRTNIQRSTFNVQNFFPTPLPAEASAKAGTPTPAPIHPAIDQPDIAIHQRLLADEVIKLLPQNCQDSLRHFYVKSINGRALGGKSTIIINGDAFTKSTPEADQEFRALFVHEMGHVLDLGCFQGSPYSGNTTYLDGEEMMYADDPSVQFYRISWLASNNQREGVTSEDFVSGYASWDMFEDFGESFAYYVLHRSEFAKRAQQNTALAAKYNWFQTYLPNLPTVAVSNYEWNGVIPWDITKLDYTWIESDEFAQR